MKAYDIYHCKIEIYFIFFFSKKFNMRGWYFSLLEKILIKVIIFTFLKIGACTKYFSNPRPVVLPLNQTLKVIIIVINWWYCMTIVLLEIYRSHYNCLLNWRFRGFFPSKFPHVVFSQFNFFLIFLLGGWWVGWSALDPLKWIFHRSW
jgi:hypothetical protein